MIKLVLSKSRKNVQKLNVYSDQIKHQNYRDSIEKIVKIYTFLVKY